MDAVPTAGSEIDPDRIAAAVLDIYDKLSRNGKPEYPKYTVLAAIVASQGANVKVLSLATGTKCAGGDIVAEHSAVLVDSHAEVLARRGFLRYLCDCIRTYETDSSFKASSDCLLRFCASSQKFMLKEDWNLYLYSSDSPCGDAAVYERTNGRSFSGKKARVCGASDVSECHLLGLGSVRLKPGIDCVFVCVERGRYSRYAVPYTCLCRSQADMIFPTIAGHHQCLAAIKLQNGTILGYKGTL